jgi:hypothetical protein
VQEGERAGESTDEGDDDDRNDEADVLPYFFAVAGDGSELAGPESDGAGSVGLNREETGFEEGGKDEESAAARDRVDEAAETGREGQEDVLEERGVHWEQGTGCRLQVTSTGHRDPGTARHASPTSLRMTARG